MTAGPHRDRKRSRGRAQVPGRKEAEQLLKLRVVRLRRAEQEVRSLQSTCFSQLRSTM